MSDAPPPGWQGSVPPGRSTLPADGRRLPYPADDPSPPQAAWPAAPPPGWAQCAPPMWTSTQWSPMRLRYDHPDGTTVLVLGVLGLMFIVIAPVAWVMMGSRALREIDISPPAYVSNRGRIVVGRICGIIGTCLLAMTMVAAIVLILVAVALS